MPDPRTLLRRRPLLALIILLILLGVGYGARALGGDGRGDGGPPSPSVSTSNSTSTSTSPSSARANGQVALSSLPAQASDTVRLIQRGGPYPYRQDGVVFNNAERHLPIHPSGYYHEYTVKTPGSPDRGTRRIITGGGQYFYTADHYDSFVAVNVKE